MNDIRVIPKPPRKEYIELLSKQARAETLSLKSYGGDRNLFIRAKGSVTRLLVTKHGLERLQRFNEVAEKYCRLLSDISPYNKTK